MNKTLNALGGGMITSGGLMGLLEKLVDKPKPADSPLDSQPPKMHKGGVVPKTGTYTLKEGEKVIPAKARTHVNPFEQFTTEERQALSRGEHAPGMIDPFTQRSDEEQQHYCPLKDLD